MSVEYELSFRKALSVNEIIVFKSGDSYPLCPRCKVSIEREYMKYCDRCGQCLCWVGFRKAKIIRRN